MRKRGGFRKIANVTIEVYLFFNVAIVFDVFPFALSKAQLIMISVVNRLSVLHIPISLIMRQYY
jgi:hypothetical protein